ncbi:hypothetical protein ACR720_04585 [Sphingomonas parapaucimobilis]|uniref:hypothetical protein n=1 Tax=Sphingomonas parapaucimobilis TaxID=28213 RepID=UPI0039EA8CBF
MGQAKKKQVSTKVRRAVRTERDQVADLAKACGVPDAQVGNLGLAKIVDLSGELGERQKTYTVLVNRGGTAIDRWINGDKAGLFGEPQQLAIRHTQRLWVRADGHLRALDPARDVVDEHVDGMSQQEALDELQRYKDRMPRPYWDVYENVCRFDEEAGVAGARIATNARSAVDAAKTTVAFAASLIAMWRGL